MVDPNIMLGKQSAGTPNQFDQQDAGPDCGYPAAYDGVAQQTWGFDGVQPAKHTVDGKNPASPGMVETLYIDSGINHPSTGMFPSTVSHIWV